MNQQTAFITGATSGFGQAIAHRLASDGFNLIICGRRSDRLEKYSDDIMKQYPVKIYSLTFDVKKKSEVTNSIASLPAEFTKIDVLVNNAGGAHGFDLIQDANTDDWDEMLDTNVKGLLYVTKAVLPLMNESKNPYIFNIGSTAAKYVYEKGNIYCATKFAVDALTQAMRIDLLKKKIRVTAIHPGMAETEFSIVRFKGDAEKAKTVYKGLQPLTANDIADVLSYCLHTPVHVNINELVITPSAQANPFYINRM
ncbi:MAG TPA: NAD(P)-dependent oxidoreductase [Bacteroidetes bacterium]|nr:NAD(P)-dependent oxidoreductase [Bacteroidota bacterium]